MTPEHKALVEAEASFEKIRTTLVNHLNEPERSAFWEAVDARDKIRESLSAQGGAEAEPVAWMRPQAIDALTNAKARGFEGVQTMLSTTKGRHNTIPIYTRPTPVPNAVEALQETIDEAYVAAVAQDKARWPAEAFEAGYRAALASNKPVGDGYVPYLWQCKDYADGWISYADREEALAYQRDTGCLLRVTYRPLSASGESSR